MAFEEGKGNKKNAKELWNELPVHIRQTYLDQGMNYLDWHREFLSLNEPQGPRNPRFTNQNISRILDAGEEGLRKSRNLHHQKQRKIITQDHIPISEEGYHGDLRLVFSGGSSGPRLYANWKGVWNVVAGIAGTTGAGEQSRRGGGSGGRGYGQDKEVINFRDSGYQSFNEPPSYDSGWVTANHDTDVTITHNLNLTAPPRSISIWASNNPSPAIGTNTIVRIDTQTDANGVNISLSTANALKVHIGDTKLYANAGFGASPPSDITDGYIRVYIVK